MKTLTICAAVIGLACTPAFDVEETTIAEIHAAMEAGTLTARELVQAYLDRIEAYDKQGPYINSIITINPQALERADELDSAMAASGFVGPLHGIPVMVKDNYDTFDLPTTNGTLAFKNSIPPDDAYQVRKIREAGAIIIGKSNLAEFASSGSFTVSSVLPGYSRNPYDPLRVTAGSSGGTGAAVAANFCTVGLGTDTGSSIRGPASHQALVGFRTTMGLASRDGIAPLSLARDVGGPMARTVADAVAVLEVIVGHDPADPVTAASEGNIPDNYRQFLDSAGLAGARIGVLRQLFEMEDPLADWVANYEEDEDSAPPAPRLIHPEVLRLMNQAVADMETAGAIIVDSLEIPDLEEIRDDFPTIRRLRHDFEAYLATRPEVPLKTLEDILESGDYHPYLRFNLERYRDAEDVAPEDHPEYQQYLDAGKRLQDAVLAVMDEHELDVLVYPTFNYPPRLIGDLNTPYGANSGTLSPPTGFPAFNVPMGFSFGRLPAGMQLLGRPFDEPTLIKISYAYEQATRHRRAPALTPPLD
jgi:Asp-tRNA(Asn)/Glu-tRNA(Gln) amidotransferase A subunit family amidase